ncbi:MAG: response regulator, partial [Chitinophagaceae bacterium]
MFKFKGPNRKGDYALICSILSKAHSMQKKILYLDDDPLALFILETILSEEGYSVKSIRTSDLLFPLIKSFHPDLIILDIKLEDGDGRQICNELKIDETTRHIPV